MPSRRVLLLRLPPQIRAVREVSKSLVVSLGGETITRRISVSSVRGQIPYSSKKFANLQFYFNLPAGDVRCKIIT